MAMGYAGAQARTIERDEIAKLCSVEAKAFDAALAADGVDFDTFCQKFEDEEENSQCAASRAAWGVLAAAIEKATETEGAGLSIEPNHHDSEADGSKYEVDGGFIEVTGY